MSKGAYRLTSEELLRRFGITVEDPSLPLYPQPELSITFPRPSPKLLPNCHTHWAVKAKAASQLKDVVSALVRLHYYGVGSDRRVVKYGPPRWARASVAIIWRSGNRRHPDPDGIISCLKAAFDGAEEAGLIRNDKDLFQERPQILLCQPRKAIGVTLIFKKEE